MTPEQEAAIARVRHRLERMAHFGVFSPDRSQEKSLRADRRAERAMLFRSAEGGMNSATWMHAQLKADCTELLREAQSDRVSFDAARIVATTLRRDRIPAPDCLKEFETKLISGEIAAPNKNGNYTADQWGIDTQINQCISELSAAGFKKTIGNHNNVFQIVSDVLKRHDITMGEEAIKTAYRRTRRSAERSKADSDKEIAEYAAKRGES